MNIVIRVCDVADCPRCRCPHPLLAFAPLNGVAEWWALCPLRQEPLAATMDGVARQMASVDELAVLFGEQNKPLFHFLKGDRRSTSYNVDFSTRDVWAAKIIL